MATGSEERVTYREESVSESEGGVRPPLSKAAVFAFLCSLASVFGLANMLLWFFAPTAVALSVFALLLIRRQHGAIRGQSLAVTAMAIAMTIGTWGIVRSTVHKYFMIQRAEKVAEKWLEIVQSGDKPRAYAMYGESRQTTSFSPPQAQMQMNAFFDQEPFYTILNSKGTFAFRGVVKFDEWPMRSEITLHYDFYPEGEREYKIPVVLSVARTFHFQKGYFFWFISSVRSTPKST